MPSLSGFPLSGVDNGFSHQFLGKYRSILLVNQRTAKNKIKNGTYTMKPYYLFFILEYRRTFTSEFNRKNGGKSILYNLLFL